MATYDQNWPADTLAISDIPGAIREKGRQLKEDGIVKPAAHKSSHAIGGTDVLTPADIGAVPASDVSTTAAANKIIKANASGLLSVSITGNAATAGDANTVGGKAASAFFPNLTYYTGDLNNLSTPGLYQVDSAVVTNEPEATWGSIYVSYISTTNWVQQLWVGQTGNVWVRRSYDNASVRTWDSWKRLAFTSDIPAQKSHGKQLFTANGNFTVPTGITTVWVSMSGGGGGGGGGYYNAGSGGDSSTAYSASGGGGAAAVIAYPISVAPGTAITVTIGSGGSGATSNTAGSAGGTTSFGSYLSCAGGGGGGKGSASGGAGGSSGGNGGSYGGSYDGGSGHGGDSIFGAPGTPNSSNKNASGYGAGGAGGFGYYITGGSGAPGFCLVEW